MTLRWLRALPIAITILAGCGDDDPLGTISPEVREGGNRIWEASAAELPSAFDFLAERRLFLGGGEVGPSAGDVFVQGVGPELRLRSISGLVRALEVHAVGLQDLGPVDFDEVRRLPTEGYLDTDDEEGLLIQPGHVYAARIRRSTLGVNYAKLIVDEVGGEVGERFIVFRYAAQVQFDNPDVIEDESE